VRPPRHAGPPGRRLDLVSAVPWLPRRRSPAPPPGARGVRPTRRRLAAEPVRGLAHALPRPGSRAAGARGGRRLGGAARRTAGPGRRVDGRRVRAQATPAGLAGAAGAARRATGAAVGGGG